MAVDPAIARALGLQMMEAINETSGAYGEIANESEEVDPQALNTWREQLFTAQAQTILDFIEQRGVAKVVNVTPGPGIATGLPTDSISFV